MADPQPIIHGTPFRAFLSHRYKSPEVNEYFFRLFSSEILPQFYVDKGAVATSVTRLERLIRGSDAFIGFYPFPPDADPTIAMLRQESRYFRLELDLAERASKPTIAFIDERYGNVLAPSPHMVSIRFKHEEVTLNADVPREAEFRSRIADFCSCVAAARTYDLSRRVAQEGRTGVGILLPENGERYGRQHLDLIAAEIERLTPRQAVPLRWPPILDSRFAATLEQLDWVVIDIGATSAVCGIVGYLHGRFVPMLRLCYVSSEQNDISAKSPLEKTLYGAYEVGYPKDIVRWSTEASLQAEIERRIKLIYAEQTRIATLEEALRYFRSAALRNEAIFVSYSGQDVEGAARIVAALRQKFQQVFDYRADNQPIPAGAYWIEEIFKQIAARPVGVLLLSPDYLASGNCKHEARQMLAQQDSGKMKLVPVKLQPGKLELPPEFNSIQYLRAWDYTSPSAIAAAIVHAIDASPSGTK